MPGKHLDGVARAVLVGVLRQWVGAERDLLAVAEPVGIRVGDFGLGPGLKLLGVGEAIAVGVNLGGAARVRPGSDLLLVGEAIPVGVH